MILPKRLESSCFTPLQSCLKYTDRSHQGGEAHIQNHFPRAWVHTGCRARAGEKQAGDGSWRAGCLDAVYPYNKHFALFPSGRWQGTPEAPEE